MLRNTLVAWLLGPPRPAVQGCPSRGAIDKAVGEFLVVVATYKSGLALVRQPLSARLIRKDRDACLWPMKSECRISILLQRTTHSTRFLITTHELFCPPPLPTWRPNLRGLVPRTLARSITQRQTKLSKPQAVVCRHPVRLPLLIRSGRMLMCEDLPRRSERLRQQYVRDRRPSRAAPRVLVRKRGADDDDEDDDEQRVKRARLTTDDPAQAPPAVGDTVVSSPQVYHPHCDRS